MGFAAAANVPALLIGDIHRGGVIASIIGTFAVLRPADRNRIKGFLINKFHGDPTLFSEGRKFLEAETCTPCLGVVPHFPAAAKLPAEDAVALEQKPANVDGNCRICVLRLPRIANFDDLDPLRLETGVNIQFIGPGEAAPGNARLVIVPGSKSTMADFAALRAQGWDIDLKAHVRRGAHVLGQCGGYQMLGRRIHDPQGLEGPPGSIDGLGLLDVETTLLPDKTLTRVDAVHAASGMPIAGYEIHLGQTTGSDCARPFAHIGTAPDGAMSANGRVMGTYIHGCFAGDEFRRAFLATLGAKAGGFAFDAEIERTLDDLAAHLASHLDLDRILALAGPV
jgi:adenosylcobyric acid synthase